MYLATVGRLTNKGEAANHAKLQSAVGLLTREKAHNPFLHRRARCDTAPSRRVAVHQASSAAPSAIPPIFEAKPSRVIASTMMYLKNIVCAAIVATAPCSGFTSLSPSMARVSSNFCVFGTLASFSRQPLSSQFTVLLFSSHTSRSVF